jgi:hypothetical protein
MAISNVFNGCTNLVVLDITNFSGESLYQSYGAFKDCPKLTTIYCDNDWAEGMTFEDNDPGSLHYELFTGCTKLVGGNGTHFDAAHSDLLYAHPDVAGNPGYFTKKDGSTMPTGISDASHLNDKGQMINENHGNGDCKSPITYNLNGQRLANPRKGLNIVGGRKVVMK